MSDNQSPSSNDQFIVFPDERQPPPPYRSAEPDPPQRPLRVFIALMLVAILVFSVGYSAIRPFILGYIDTTDFDIALTSITEATDQNCRTVEDENLPAAINSTQTLCVCGIVFAGGRRADEYQLLLRSESGVPVDTVRVESTADGEFCHRWQLEAPLTSGEYRLDVRSNRLLDTYWFRIQSVSSI
jgi:hypothetical protein